MNGLLNQDYPNSSPDVGCADTYITDDHLGCICIHELSISLLDGISTCMCVTIEKE